MTMNQEMVDILAGLKTQWSVLKDDKKTKQERMFACGRICHLSETAKELDPKFEMIDMNDTRYAEFLPETYISKSDVKWGVVGVINKQEEKALELLQRLEAISVGEIHKKLPKERMDSQKFGMIVSAYTEKLVHIYCTQNFS